MNILLTGGAGYIGSHTAVVLSEAGHQVILLDNFCNSKKAILGQLEKIVGREIPCIEGDIRDNTLVVQILRKYEINAVIHFAGLKSVSESVENPVEYYENNVQGTLSLLAAMKLCQIKTFIFSSSATVYGDPKYLPIDEAHPLSATNPYGRSKIHIEEILADLAHSDKDWRIVCLRYFNPVGAHQSGLIGESPSNIPNNLMPYIAEVATGLRQHVNVFGDDYPTIDGTGVRDYIHVMDLAEGHLAALRYASTHIGIDVFNLGTGKGASVYQVLNQYQSVSNKKIEHMVCERRPGDIASCYAKVDKAKEQLNWVSTRNLIEMCRSSWIWQSNKKSNGWE